MLGKRSHGEKLAEELQGCRVQCPQSPEKTECTVGRGGVGVQHPVPVGDGVQKPEKKALFLQGSIAPSSWGKESWDPKAGTHSFGR